MEQANFIKFSAFLVGKRVELEKHIAFYVLLVISVITNKTYFIRGEGLILRERAE